MPTPVTLWAIQDHCPSRPRYGRVNSERLRNVSLWSVSPALAVTAMRDGNRSLDRSQDPR
jgi:hypothetical protein